MEPRFFKRGNLIIEVRMMRVNRTLQWSHVFSNVEIVLVAYHRGIQYSSFNGATFFQTWKCANCRADYRAPKAASMEPRFFKRGNAVRPVVYAARVELQWSHVFSNVEIMERGGDNTIANIASMEPRFFKRGNEEDKSHAP